MGTIEDLRAALRGLDGRPYGAYRAAAGRWSLADGVELSIDHVQSDPFAPPSRMSVLVAPAVAALAPARLTDEARRIGVACLLARTFAAAAAAASRRLGSGRSGEIRMEDPGQVVRAQTAVQVDARGAVEARFAVGLPARGRRALGGEAAGILCDEVPRLVRDALVGPAYAPEALRMAADTHEDGEALRASLRGRGLVAFVADGSVLPRRSGIDDRPLGGGAVPFESPPGLRVTLEAPNAGALRGMGIPRGITLIVGGGFHGKSTLLRALETGVRGHPEGDGRERVVADADAVKIRAEDGRSVAGVDISALIDGLPAGQDTTAFGTPNASGSTSQAAALVEALEAGARVLLVDEDTAATNFMIRDRRMQALVPASGEPITPLVDRARDLYETFGVSLVVVVGGSGDWLDVADTVIRMDAFRPVDATARAREVVRALPSGRAVESGRPLRVPVRIPLPASIDLARGRHAVRVRARGEHTIELGRETIDLSAVEQIVGPAETRALAAALAFARTRLVDGERDLPHVLDGVDEAVAAGGLDVLDSRRVGDLASFRRHELAAALNRLRPLAVRAP